MENQKKIAIANVKNHVNLNYPCNNAVVLIHSYLQGFKNTQVESTLKVCYRHEC